MNGKKIIVVAVCAVSLAGIASAAETQDEQKNISILSTDTQHGKLNVKVNESTAKSIDKLKDFISQYREEMHGDNGYHGIIKLLATAAPQAIESINGIIHGSDVELEWTSNDGKWTGVSKLTGLSVGEDNEGRLLRKYEKSIEYKNAETGATATTNFSVGQKGSYNAINGSATYQKDGTNMKVEVSGNSNITDKNNAQAYVFRGEGSHTTADGKYTTTGYYSVEGDKVSGQYIVQNNTGDKMKVVNVEYNGKEPNFVKDMETVTNRVKNEDIKGVIRSEAKRVIQNAKETFLKVKTAIKDDITSIWNALTRR